ncbi:hypothetical protein RI129_012690 [Pyrocoelia pectoralis]|uniref:MADF domain-containing protein n=1 Tax=Pyrocoelia pectoralis TaxID=417401 RepID=A0AAN7UTZ7_9COLE
MSRRGRLVEARQFTSNVRFSKAEDEMLVEKVREFPTLYDHENMDFKDFQIRENIWREICNDLFGSQRRLKLCPETVRMSLKRQGYISRKPKNPCNDTSTKKAKNGFLSTFSTRQYYPFKCSIRSNQDCTETQTFSLIPSSILADPFSCGKKDRKGYSSERHDKCLNARPRTESLARSTSQPVPRYSPVVLLEPGRAVTSKPPGGHRAANGTRGERSPMPTSPPCHRWSRCCPRRHLITGHRYDIRSDVSFQSTSHTDDATPSPMSRISTRTSLEDR